MSEPLARVDVPAARLAAEPPEEPPGVIARFQGLNSRRHFIKILGGLGAGAITGVSASARPNESSRESNHTRPFAGQYMGDFAAPKLETVRCAFIGVGIRGSAHAAQIAEIEGTEVVAISDLYEDFAMKVSDDCKEKGQGNRHRNIS